MKALPDLSFETPLWEKGHMVIGVDEVGRGAFAGPLVVGAVCFSPATNPDAIKKLLSFGINDSKKLTPHARKHISESIKSESFCYSYGEVSVDLIDKYGIAKSTSTAIRKAVHTLLSKDLQKPYLLTDAFYTKHVKGIGLTNQKAIIKGDCLSLSIAAASVIAKVYRDDLMKALSLKFPVYNWSQNKGYGTVDHRQAIIMNGPSRLHRKAFIRKLT